MTQTLSFQEINNKRRQAIRDKRLEKYEQYLAATRTAFSKNSRKQTLKSPTQKRILSAGLKINSTRKDRVELNLANMDFNFSDNINRSPQIQSQRN